jgi:hypothetical protein
MSDVGLDTGLDYRVWLAGKSIYCLIIDVDHEGAQRFTHRTSELALACLLGVWII